LIDLPYRSVPDKEQPATEDHCEYDGEEGGEEEVMTEDAGFEL
jgi:hypothetical protein